MTSKHTPGPWYWSPDYKTSDGRATWSLIGSDGYGILSCDGEENSPQGLSDGANARLIAAAPELLGALQQAFDFPPDFFDRSDDELEQITVSGRHLRMVRAAIAKATGAEA